MKLKNRIAASLGLLGLATGSLLAASGAMANEGFPNGKPVTVVVPYAPGGGADILARLVSAGAAEKLGVPVIVENRPGGGSILAAQLVARAKPDGHTVLTVTSATLVMNPHLYSDLPYDPKADFTPVTMASSMPMVLAVNADFPVQTIDELTEYVRENPGQVSYAYGAAGGQIVGELYRDRAGLDMQPIGYNGSTPAQNDVLGGHLPIIVDALAPALGLLESGRLRPLAVSSAERSAAVPDVPTLQEAGLGEIDVAGLTGFSVPVGTPQEAIDKLHEAFAYALNTPKVRSHLEGLGQTVYAAPGDEFKERIYRDYDVLGEVIRTAGIAVN